MSLILLGTMASMTKRKKRFTRDRCPPYKIYDVLGKKRPRNCRMATL